MILYKYLDATGFIQSVENNTVGFRTPKDFNDPFELSSGFSSHNFLGETARKFLWEKGSVILSLTRNPLNLLMWSHYADSHQGVVVGFDVSKDLFSDLSSNIIPAQFGSVIYSNTKPSHHTVGPHGRIAAGQEYAFCPSRYEKMQRLFLHKQGFWAYEEEVRVVKGIHGIEKKKDLPSGRFEIESSHSRSLYTLKLPPNSVREVYFGSQCRFELGIKPRLCEILRTRHAEIKFHKCLIDSGSWNLTFRLEDC